MPTYVQCSYFIFEVKKTPNAFTFTFYTTCPVFPPHLIRHSCWNNRALSGLFCFYCKVSKQASPCQMMCMHTQWKTMPLVCRKVFAGTVLLIYEKRCTSCCECKTSISCFFMFSKCIKRLLEVTQVSHHTFSAWVNATLLSHETVYTIKL